MNYYQYGRRRTPEATKKKTSDYLKPFIVLVIFIAIIIAGWKLLSTVFGEDEPGETGEGTEEKAQVEIQTGSAKVMASGSEEYKTIPDAGVDVFEGEKVQTLSDGRVTLDFFDQTQARLDEVSAISLETLSKGSTDSQIDLTLEKGGMWINMPDTTNANLNIKTDTFIAKASSGNRFALSAPDTLYVIAGTVSADILNADGKVIKTLDVGIGQQLAVTDSALQDLENNVEPELLFSVDENFKDSDWYKWNQQRDGGGAIEEEDPEEECDETDPEASCDTDPSEEDEDPEDEDSEDEDIEGDEDGPSAPKITSPGKNGAEVTLDKAEQFISGTVSEDTEKVVVNEYELQQYVPGSEEFTYKASAALKNLKVGENEYTVTAIDEDGNKSTVAKITLTLPQSVYDAADLEEEEEDEDDNAEDEPTGGVAITAPNGGKDLSTTETSFVISGNVPDKTAVVKVNGYQLQGFKLGDSTFKYNANVNVANLKEGQKNSYAVEAFDEAGKKLGSDTIAIDLSGDTDANPEDSDENTPDDSSATGGASLSINIPTTASAYQTTLDQITLGGTVTGEPDAVFVNGNPVENYLPGEGTWTMAITLQPGENGFSAYAEKDGQSTATDSVTINYNN